MISDFTALDIETTGLDPKRDKIIEIGALRIRNGKVKDRLETMVHPGRRLEERITELTGITDDDLKDAPTAAQVIPKLLEFIGEDVLLGHRIMFDYSFVKRAAVNLNLNFEKQGIDTLKLARRFLPELEKKSLVFLCNYYQIELQAHRAGNDALAAAELYFKLAGQFPDEDAFDPFPLIYKVKKEGPITEKQKERLYKLIEQHKLVIDYEIDMLTRNEASRITDKIILQYGREL